MSVCKVSLVGQHLTINNKLCIAVDCTAASLIKRTPDDVNGMSNFILSGGDCVDDCRKLWKDMVFNYLNIQMWCYRQEKKCGPELIKWEVIHCCSCHGSTPSSSSVRFQRILLELGKVWRRKLRMTKHGNTWFIVTYYVMTFFEYFASRDDLLLLCTLATWFTASSSVLLQLLSWEAVFINGVVEIIFVKNSLQTRRRVYVIFITWLF